MKKKIDKFKEPYSLSIKFANTVFIFGILYSILFIIFSIYKILYPPDSGFACSGCPSSMATQKEFYYVCILLGSIFAILFIFGLTINNKLKINLSLLCITVGISFYIFEIFLMFFPQPKLSLQKILEQMEVTYDKRTKIEVFNNLYKKDVEAYTFIPPSFFVESNWSKSNYVINANNVKMFPLGGISNVTTIFCNKGKNWVIYESDEHGFNNTKELYKKNEIDIILVGDSFTHGTCVESDENIGSVLREFGFNAINLGSSDNGPLIEFAVLKEYAVPLKPKIVLWLYYPNDIGNLDSEITSSLLRRYLEENDFSQNLISRQDEIDGVLKNYFQKLLVRERIISQNSKLLNLETKKENKENIAINWTIIKKILKLTNFRSKFNLQPQPGVRGDFIEILAKSKKTVSSWGGKLYFVYLPDYLTYSNNKKHLYRKTILQVANELNIPIIDMHKEAFGLHSDPLSLFPFRKLEHYNAEGYRLVAETISKRLKDDEIIPLELDNF